MNLPAILGLGFLLGMRHALDTDHIAAVSTIVARERSLRSAAPIGVLWGLGHTLTIVLVGGAIVLFKVVIPPHLGLSMELCVGVMLVVLGALSLRNAFTRHRHAHVEPPPSGLSWRPLLVGIVHGMAGSAAVGLLVLGAVPSVTAGLLYLLVFGLGTIAGMLLFTTALAVPVALVSLRFERWHRALAVVTAVASVTLGISLAYRIGVNDGLFTENPSWTPH
jgi:sulfite exporter TauE/SafE